MTELIGRSPYDDPENANDHEWKGARTSGVTDLNVVVHRGAFAPRR